MKVLESTFMPNKAGFKAGDPFSFNTVHSQYLIILSVSGYVQ
jgi:hypothetical protein